MAAVARSTSTAVRSLVTNILTAGAINTFEGSDCDAGKL